MHHCTKIVSTSPSALKDLHPQSNGIISCLTIEVALLEVTTLALSKRSMATRRPVALSSDEQGERQGENGGDDKGCKLHFESV